LVLALGVLLAGPASAHPLGNFTINLYSGLVVEPGHLRVNYVLDMAEIPTFQERSRIDADGDGLISGAERTAYAERKARELMRGVTATAGTQRVAFHVAASAMRFRPGQAGWSTPILRLTAEFDGRIGDAGTLEYHDGNYADRIGWREITAVGADGEVLRGSPVPVRSISDALLRYPTALLSSPLRVTGATLRFTPGRSAPASTMPRDAAGAAARPLVTGGSFARLATWTHLSIPLVALALLLAMGFGAAHALLPGHGKTIMAGYLVGAGGRKRQAVQVGIAVAFMHTVSVLAIGAVVLLVTTFAAERVYPWIGLASGLVVVLLGVALFASRARAARGHSHGVLDRSVPFEVEHARQLVSAGRGGGPILVDDPPAHDHGHPHEILEPDRPLSRKSLAGLAVAGGILPSPTALVVLLSTVSTHRVAFGLALIMAFSIGLAGALVTVGLLALRARELVSRRLRGGAARLLPLLSAALIVGVGVFLAVRSTVQL
jgi:ABC-type nickel/cobalt efflux system permease component RcnA